MGDRGQNHKDSRPHADMKVLPTQGHTKRIDHSHTVQCDAGSHLYFKMHMQLYKVTIAIVLHLLRQQQEGLLSSAVTTDHMTRAVQAPAKRSIRVQIWDFEMEGKEEEEARPLHLSWDVMNQLKMGEAVFEARQLLMSPEDIPESFLDPKMLRLAQEFSDSLRVFTKCFHMKHVESFCPSLLSMH